MATTTLQTINPLREMLQIGVLVALAVLLATQDMRGITPLVLLGLAGMVALNGYNRTRWACPAEGDEA